MNSTNQNKKRSGRGGGRGRGRGGGRGGRGRGGAGRGGGSRSGGRGQQQQQQTFHKAGATGRRQQQQQQPGGAPLLRNGDKGAEVHTVSEKERIRLTRILMELRENDEVERQEFPSTLTNTERKFLHELAAQLGLKSKSTGKDENRHIVVTKRAHVVKQTANDDDSLPVLKVGRKGTEALRKHVQRFPPTHTEELESHSTGASLLEALGSGVAAGEGGDDDGANGNEMGNNDQAVQDALAQMGLLGKEEAPVGPAPTVHVDLDRRTRHHAAAQKTKHSHNMYPKMQAARSKLPAFEHENEIVNAVANNVVTIISGETGSGKTTQVPQFLLDANPAASIVVTQPRRISAISVAERVAQEQCLEPVGGMVGYQVRLESAISRDTQVVFLTPGVLLRKLQSSHDLREFTHVILDEIHEKSAYTEFLMVALRDMLAFRDDLRIILMSATLQIDTLIDYWRGFPGSPAHVHLQGRTFPVQDFFLEQVLSMTSYLGEVTGDGTSEDLEAELRALTSTETDTALTCVMCGKGGFLDASELGTHIALCDGGGDVSMDVLESRVRQVDDRPAVAVRGDGINLDDDGEEDDNGKKWDGVSPFEVGDSIASEPTLSEEKLLEQYQTMQNDEEVDYSLLLHVVQFIVKSSFGDGAILVFFSGWQEISEFSLLLESTHPFNNKSKYLVLPLHSGIPSRDQRKVFQQPPQGVRKIILSTNIAETSVTIDGVSFVVDTGRAKEKSYDPFLKTSTLQPTWISQASAQQRKGRAGRTKAGVCFRLFSSRRFLSMREFVDSELLRTPLEEMCLLCKKLLLAPGGPEDADGVPAFLSKAMSPPHTKSVTNALELLVDLGAMEPVTNNLTTLGHCLSILSLEPRVGKMVIWSYLLGCTRSTSMMAVAMSYKSPFVLPPTSMQRSADSAKLHLSKNSESDQMTVLFALRERDQLMKRNRGSGAVNDFCRRNFLGVSTMQMISDLRRNLTREVTSLGFPNPTDFNQYHNRHDDDQSLWQAAIAAGLYPNIATRKRDEVNFSTMTNRKAKIHVSSVNAVRGQPLNQKCQSPKGEVEFVVFGEIVKGKTSFTMNQTTHLSSPLPLFLLCGTSLSVRPLPDDPNTAVLDVDDWILFRCNADTASHIVILRKRLEAAFWHYIADPSAGLTKLTGAERDAVEMLGTVVQSAHRSVSAGRGR